MKTRISRKTTILLLAFTCAALAANGCTCPEERYAEQRVDHKAVMRIRVGTKEERMFAILKIPAYEEGFSETRFLVFGEDCTVITNKCYCWHYDTEQDIVFEMSDGEVVRISYEKRLDLPPKQESPVAALVNRLLVGM